MNLHDVIEMMVPVMGGGAREDIGGVGRGAEINCGFSPRDVSSSARIYHSFTGLLHLFANITAIMYATRANVK